MDFDENLYDKIQAYLDKELSPAETKEFESAIAADEDLAREVELHADMQEFLSDTPENSLRKNLEKLGAEASEDGGGLDWRFLALIPIVLVIIGFLMFDRNASSTSSKGMLTTPPPIDSITTQPTIDSVSVPSPVAEPEDKKDELKTNKKAPETPNPPKKKIKKRRQPKAPPIIEIKPSDEKEESTDEDTELFFAPFTLDTTTYAYIDDGPVSSNSSSMITQVLSSPSNPEYPFEPDAQLDSLVAIDYLANEGYSLDIKHLIPDTIRMPIDSISTASHNADYLRELGLYFEADMETADSLSKDRFILTTKNNLGETWSLSYALTEPVEKSPYKIDVIPFLPYSEGLYYYEIYDEINERQIFAGKYNVICIPIGYTPAETSIAFNTNRRLEKLAKKSRKMRSRFQIIRDTMSKDFSLTYPSYRVDFQYEGLILTKEDLNTKNLKLHLFSNKEEDFKNFSPVVADDFSADEVGVNVFDFLFERTYYLSPGLYYFTITDADTNKIFYTNKIIVRGDKANAPKKLR